MAKRALGIHIGHDAIDGVVIEEQGKKTVVLSCASVPCFQYGELGEPLDQLLETLDWQDGSCICGIGLARISTRNIRLPFTDKKQIFQTLPHELDDQLIQSIDEVVTDFDIIDTQGDTSHLHTFAVDKVLLSDLLQELQQKGIDPDAILPSVKSINEILTNTFPQQNILVLQADFFSVTMSFIYNGQCWFTGRMPYPEKWIVDAPLFEQARAATAEASVDMVSLYQEIGAAIRKNLDFLRIGGFPVDKIDRILGFGILADLPVMCREIEQLLDQMVEPVRLSTLLQCDVPESCADVSPARYETALSLAWASKEKKSKINFRKQEFAKKTTLFSSKKQTIWATGLLVLLSTVFLGYYWLDYNSLTFKKKQLHTRMVQLYQEQFPSVTRIQDPYLQMQVALRDQGTTETIAPLFSGQKRVLDFLADISSRIPQKLPLQVSRMVVDQQTIRMRGITDTFNNVDEIKEALSLSTLYARVNIISATADAKTNKIRFEIQLEFGDE